MRPSKIKQDNTGDSDFELFSKAKVQEGAIPGTDKIVKSNMKTFTKTELETINKVLVVRKEVMISIRSHKNDFSESIKKSIELVQMNPNKEEYIKLINGLVNALAEDTLGVGQTVLTNVLDYSKKLPEIEEREIEQEADRAEKPRQHTEAELHEKERRNISEKTKIKRNL